LPAFRALLLAILCSATVLAGCTGPANPPAPGTSSAAHPTASEAPSNATLAKANRTVAPATGIRANDTAVQVSAPGHRTSEFTVARDPTNRTHLVAAAMDWDSADGIVQCAAFVSRNGGADWTTVPALPGHVSTHEDTDPWVAVDGRGHAWLTCTEGGTGLLLGESPDGGLTWNPAQVVPTGGVPAKDSIGAFGDGELYLCFQQGGQLQVMHSLDGGTSWSQFGIGNVQAGCNGIARGPDGATYVLWQSGGQLEADNLNPAPPGVGLGISTDGGRTWHATHIDDELGAAPPNMQSAPQAAAPSLAVSNVTGTLFVAAQRYQNAETGGVGTATQASALLVRSRDHGDTFQNLTLPRFPTEACTGCNEVHPTLAVDDAGRLYLQVTLANGDDSHKEVWMAVSNDEGDSWLAFVSLAAYDPPPVQPMNFVPDPAAILQDAKDIAQDPASAPAAAQARADAITWPLFHRDGGEYFGIATVPGAALGMWVEPDAQGRNAIVGRIVTVFGPTD
jgi:hypothetical protein